MKTHIQRNLALMLLNHKATKIAKATQAPRLLLCALCAFVVQTAHAQLTIPGADGSDGALNITTNTVIDLSQAVTSTWDADNSADAGKGIYDAAKWAVVFKYSSVTIAPGTTVTFKNHGSGAPVVWLVSGNATIDGVLSLDGEGFSSDPVHLPEGGPGGFRGGARLQDALGAGNGFGPGGGDVNDVGGGAYATHRSYGNPQIVPLIGGSGGGGCTCGVNGSGGGGAILIVAAGSITVSSSGRITANGGTRFNSYQGSGGAVRLVADEISGSGRIEATSETRQGRIRLEANTASPLLSLNPPTTATAPEPVVIWPASNAPGVRVVSVSGQAATADPRARLDASGMSDVTISTNVMAAIFETTNFPTNGTVNVYVKPRNAIQQILPASLMSGNDLQATWRLQIPAPVGPFVIQVRAVSP